MITHTRLVSGKDVDQAVAGRSVVLMLEAKQCAEGVLEKRRHTGGLFTITIQWESDADLKRKRGRGR